MRFILDMGFDNIFSLQFTMIPDMIYVNNIEFTALSICLSEFTKFIEIPPYPRAAIFGYCVMAYHFLNKINVEVPLFHSNE